MKSPLLFTIFVSFSYESQYFALTCRSSIADVRTGSWLLMSSPLPQTIIIAAYIFFVTSWGPRLMENRKAFDLKGVLIFYNFGVVALSLYMVYEVSLTLCSLGGVSQLLR